jgi:hypothetical protein
MYSQQYEIYSHSGNIEHATKLNCHRINNTAHASMQQNSLVIEQYNRHESKEGKKLVTSPLNNFL